jgi:hypothetical protein
MADAPAEIQCAVVYKLKITVLASQRYNHVRGLTS